MISDKPKNEKKDNSARKIIGSAIVNAGPLNVRKTPSPNGEIVGEAQRGQRFNVTDGSTDTFTAIIFKDEIRFAMTKYLDVTIDA